MNSLPKTVTRQRRDCDLNPGPSAPESSTLKCTRLPSHPHTVEEANAGDVVAVEVEVALVPGVVGIHDG